MDRPKHRRLASRPRAPHRRRLLLLGRQWTSTSDPARIPATFSDEPRSSSSRSPIQHRTVNHRSKLRRGVAAPPSASSAATRTGFRGHVIDAITRRPVKEFEVQLIRVRRDDYTEHQPIIRNFKIGRPAVSPGRMWMRAPGERPCRPLDIRCSMSRTLQISEGKTTREIVMPLLRGFAGTRARFRD